MTNKLNDSAAARAAAAAEARRQAERKAAAEAARKVADAAKKASEARAQPARAKVFNDQHSDGRGSALRKKALSVTGATKGKRPDGELPTARLDARSLPAELRNRAQFASQVPSAANGKVAPEVRSSVDAVISPTASQADRQRAYEAVQAYVDKVGGVGDAGITADALPGKAQELLSAQNIPTRAVEDAAQKVKDVAKNGTPAEVAKALEDQTRNLSGPQLDAVLAQLEPTLRDVAGRVNADKGNGDQARDFYSAMVRVGERAGPDGVAALARAASNGFPNGKLEDLDNAISDAVQRGEGTLFATALAGELTRTGKTKGANDVTAAIVDGVQHAKDDYAKAADAYQVTQGRLTEELALLGPALSPAQRKEYEAKFWADPENKAIKDTEAATSARFSQVMEESHGALEAAAASGNKGAAKALLEGYEQLARSPEHADEAIAFAGRVNQAGSALFDALQAAAPDHDVDKFFQEKVLVYAVPNAQAEIFASGVSADEADAQMKALFKDLKGVGKLAGVPKAIKTFLDDVASIRAGTYDPIKRSLESWESKTAFGKTMAIASVAGGLYGAVKGFEDGNIPAALKGLLTGTAGGLQLASGLLGTFSKAGKLAESTAGDFAKVAGRFAPGIGLAIDLLSAYQGIDALQDGATPGEIVTLIGTGISLVGDIAGFVPILGTAVDAVLGVIGGGLQIVGGIMGGGGENLEQKEIKEQAKILESMGFSKKDAEVLSNAADQGVIDGLSQLGMSPEDVRAAVKEFTWMADGGLAGSITDLSWVEAIGGAFGVKGHDFLTLLRSADMRNNDYFGMIGDVHREAVDKLRKGDVDGYRKALLDGLRERGAPKALIDQLQRAFDAHLPVVSDLVAEL